MDGGGRGEAERWLQIAERLLAAHDLVGSKQFAERAIESDPLLDGVDQILAIAEVLVAAQNRVNDHYDWYAILGLTHDRDPPAIKRQYRRLALLLHPDRNKSPGADSSFKLVVDAWGVLSDPAKKSLFDAELEAISASAAAAAPPVPAVNDPTTFWTSCPFCCHVHQYLRLYVGCNLPCPNCRQAFRAAEITVPPPIVPGTNMYYCSWGFFPLGYPGGPAAPESGWRPFYPMHQFWAGQHNQPVYPAPQGRGGGAGWESPMENKGVGAGVGVGTGVGAGAAQARSVRSRKMVARKSVGGGSSAKKSVLVQETNAATPAQPEASTVSKPADINMNEDVKIIDVDELQPGASTESKHAEINMNEDAKVIDDEVAVAMPPKDTEVNGEHMDIDAKDKVMDNLQNIPFLKVEETQNQNL